MKKIIVLIMLVLLSYSFLKPREANAFATMGAIWQPVVFLGAYLVITGTYCYYNAYGEDEREKFMTGMKQKTALGRFFEKTFIYVFIPYLIGVVLLEDGESSTPQFTEISQEEGLRLGATEAEIYQYNNEIDEVNVIQGLSTLAFKKGSNSESSLEDSMKVWEKYKSSINKDTHRVIYLITAQMVNRISSENL